MTKVIPQARENRAAEKGELLRVVPRGGDVVFIRSHRGFEAEQYLGGFGENEITALESFKLIARRNIPRAELSDAIALRQSQIFCRRFHRAYQSALGAFDQ